MLEFDFTSFLMGAGLALTITSFHKKTMIDEILGLSQSRAYLLSAFFTIPAVIGLVDSLLDNSYSQAILWLFLILYGVRVFLLNKKGMRNQ